MVFKIRSGVYMGCSMIYYESSRLAGLLRSGTGFLGLDPFLFLEKVK